MGLNPTQWAARKNERKCREEAGRRSKSARPERSMWAEKSSRLSEQIVRNEMETMANAFDAELVGLINRAKHMADCVVPAAAAEREDWLEVREHFIRARNLIQRTRYRDDRAPQMYGEDYDRLNGILKRA